MHRHLLASLCLLILAQPAFSAPRVVASIAPLHALTAGVMRGVAEPICCWDRKPARMTPACAPLRRVR